VSIVRHLVATWKIPSLSLSGKAARSQDFLCKHAEKVESMAEAVAAKIMKEPRTRFSWIDGRLA
jgi:acyl-[acyl-carrier-protein] desaturase